VFLSFLLKNKSVSVFIEEKMSANLLDNKVLICFHKKNSD